ncbi:MAG: hypothetical protein JSS02_25365 [Planctomycetes bacterium]|nr:hypothetical protein [Planctomycetota bacterium]
MNCDTAFDLMTDSEGCHSRALVQHLESCPRCRQMLDALSPALDFLAEDTECELDALPDSTSSHALDLHACPASAESLQIVRQASARLEYRSGPSSARTRRTWGQSIKYAAAFAAGVFLASVVLFPRERATSVVPTECTRFQLASAESTRSSAETLQLAQSCAICHQSSDPGQKEHSSDRSRPLDGSWDWLRQLLDEPATLPHRAPAFDEAPLIAVGHLGREPDDLV